MSCSDYDFQDENRLEYVENHSMNFQVDLVVFDSSSTHSRAQNNELWENGSCVYLDITNTVGGTNYGKAVYNSASGWTYTGTLTKGSNLKCKAYYIKNPTSIDGDYVELDKYSSIYEDENASFSYNGTEVIVNCHLSPKTGRIRFKGVPGERLYISGIKTYDRMLHTSYFEHSYEVIEATVNGDGYTPYIYGILFDSYTISVGSRTYACTRKCNSSVLSVGKSGYMDSPSKNRTYWEDGFYIRLEGYSGRTLDFKMIPVYGYSEGFFLMGETEVTEAQYSVLYGGSSTSTLPYTNKSFSSSDIKNYVTTLNEHTGLFFSLPTAEQWLYAAKGGMKSKGYKYSGSNIISNVAWYNGNTTDLHSVKQKSPNEIGLYDMSGNASEVIRDGTHYQYGGSYAYGGSYLESASACEVGSTKAVNTYLNDKAIGFRLILTLE